MMFTNKASDEGLICKVYKEFTQLNMYQKNPQQSDFEKMDREPE